MSKDGDYLGPFEELQSRIHSGDLTPAPDVETWLANIVVKQGLQVAFSIAIEGRQKIITNIRTLDPDNPIREIKKATDRAIAGCWWMVALPVVAVTVPVLYIGKKLFGAKK
jgi:hypothetical protein